MFLINYCFLFYIDNSFWNSLNLMVNGYRITLQAKISGLQNVSHILSYKDGFSITELKSLDYATIIGQNQLIAFCKNDRYGKMVFHSFFAPSKFVWPLYHIRSYVYEKLNGISTSTQAKGMTMFYSYGLFMRLKNIKNQFGHIIKAFEYHYAH